RRGPRHPGIRSTRFGLVQIGCGVTSKEIRGRRYLYFWHYEERGGRRVQAFRYLGALRSEVARQKLEEVLDAYLDRLAAELRRRRGELLARALPPSRPPPYDGVAMATPRSVTRAGCSRRTGSSSDLGASPGPLGTASASDHSSP